MKTDITPTWQRIGVLAERVVERVRAQMIAEWEIQDSKVAVDSARQLIIRSGGIFRGAERSPPSDFAAALYDGAEGAIRPFLKAAVTVRPTGYPVDYILRVIGNTQVAPPIIKAVPVDVVNELAALGTNNKPVHINRLPAAAAHRVNLRAAPAFMGCGAVPCVRGNQRKAICIDNRNVPVRERKLHSFHVSGDLAQEHVGLSGTATASCFLKTRIGHLDLGGRPAPFVRVVTAVDALTLEFYPRQSSEALELRRGSGSIIGAARVLERTRHGGQDEYAVISNVRRDVDDSEIILTTVARTRNLGCVTERRVANCNVERAILSGVLYAVADPRCLGKDLAANFNVVGVGFNARYVRALAADPPVPQSEGTNARTQVYDAGPLAEKRKVSRQPGWCEEGARSRIDVTGAFLPIIENEFAIILAQDGLRENGLCFVVSGYLGLGELGHASIRPQIMTDQREDEGEGEGLGSRLEQAGKAAHLDLHRDALPVQQRDGFGVFDVGRVRRYLAEVAAPVREITESAPDIYKVEGKIDVRWIERVFSKPYVRDLENCARTDLAGIEGMAPNTQRQIANLPIVSHSALQIHMRDKLHSRAMMEPGVVFPALRRGQGEPCDPDKAKGVDEGEDGQHGAPPRVPEHEWPATNLNKVRVLTNLCSKWTFPTNWDGESGVWREAAARSSTQSRHCPSPAARCVFTQPAEGRCSASTWSDRPRLKSLTTSCRSSMNAKAPTRWPLFPGASITLPSQAWREVCRR